MYDGHWFALGASVLLIIFLVVLLRRRSIKEKYASVWLAVGVVVCIFAAFPGLVSRLAHVVGISIPSNFVFALAILLLLAVTIQLSVEMSTAEEETRTLAEEIAMLRLEVEKLSTGLGQACAADPKSQAGQQVDGQECPGHGGSQVSPSTPPGESAAHAKS